MNSNLDRILDELSVDDDVENKTEATETLLESLRFYMMLDEAIGKALRNNTSFDLGREEHREAITDRIIENIVKELSSNA